ncbi:hypothetical protein L861_05045 [Litchfieldella anticariensis FP35 = DSM 16096]|uniref:DUF4412 domain-containing protein n=1 Tax=Litchfieldella anticariensis (strain DSM 16096 / CECT 5854 / CIP 108499 / LMG 22089 / FP35) TaxID=1121939 RepID=S2LBL6_LITA3|nr:hypothetical protein [Halomonas anticariensis]EPC02126.1 hypothetical protein L861_05045 [Halomonas anticariensis FP35 = DSM 16096]
MKYLVAGLMLATALPVFADGKATIATSDTQNDMQMVIHWTDDSMRMDFPAQQQGYMLMRDGKGYMVTEQAGQPIVMDMAMLKGMTEAMGEEANAVNANQAKSVESLEATGEKETVAGIEGDVYRIQWTDHGGNAHDDQMVLSDEPLGREMLQAFQSYVQIVMDEPDPIGTALLERDLGMLKFGDKFRVVEMADASPEAAMFELPENAMTMEDLMKQQMGGGANAPQ